MKQIYVWKESRSPADKQEDNENIQKVKRT